MNSKITSEHLRRSAAVYIRQSTPTQVLENTESQRRQYELVEAARTRHHTVGAIVRTLLREGRIRHDSEGRYSLVASPTEKPSPPNAANATRPPGIARFPVPGSANP